MLDLLKDLTREDLLVLLEEVLAEYRSRDVADPSS
jgi:hypothetical protein